MALMQKIQRRVSALGMSERSGEVDEFGMDEVVLRRARPILDLLYDRYVAEAASKRSLNGVAKKHPQDTWQNLHG